MSTFAIAARIDDQIDAEQLRDILAQEGVVVRLIGPTHAVNMQLFSADLAEWRIEVPEDQVVRAMELIEAYTAELEVDEAELPWELREEGDEPIDPT